LPNSECKIRGKLTAKDFCEARCCDDVRENVITHRDSYPSRPRAPYRTANRRFILHPAHAEYLQSSAPITTLDRGFFYYPKGGSRWQCKFLAMSRRPRGDRCPGCPTERSSASLVAEWSGLGGAGLQAMRAGRPSSIDLVISLILRSRRRRGIRFSGASVPFAAGPCCWV
jgi:hypothetical protein